MKNPPHLILSFFFFVAGCFSTGHTGATSVSIPADASSFFYDPSTGGANDPYIHGTTIQNYQVGYNATTEENTRNWFIFPLPAIGPGEVIGAATVSFYMPKFTPGLPESDVGDGYDSLDPTEEFAIFGLSATAKTFISATDILDDDAVADDGPLFDLWWADVDSGSELGSSIVSAADEGGFVTITFTPLGLSVLNAATGGDFLIGGAVPTLDDGPLLDEAEGFFHHTHPGGIAPPGGDTESPELIIEIVPEPSGVSLLVVGLVGILVTRRR
ncbi:MAG: PEP-CTERM sorting domain-containing protein [Akkermansiaceae bacterium]